MLYPVMPDDLRRITAVLRQACEQSDIVILMAGSSKGQAYRLYPGGQWQAGAGCCGPPGGRVFQAGEEVDVELKIPLEKIPAKSS